MRLEDLTGIERFSNLTQLNLTGNLITDIEPISKLDNLTKLCLEENNIKDITCLSQNTKLVELNLRGNSGIDEDRENYTQEKLKKIDTIGEILDRGGEIFLDVNKLKLFTNYKRLNLSSQNIEDLTCLKGMTKLTFLNLSYNPLLTLEDEESKKILKQMTELGIVYLEGCSSLRNISVFNNMESIRELRLRRTHADLTVVENILSNIVITVDESSLKTIENCNSEKITSINLSSAPIYYFESLPNLKKFTNLITLKLPSVKTSDYRVIESLMNLQTLDLSGCNLHNKLINFSQLTNLTNLNLSGNILWTEDLEN